ncbi:phosphotransferase [Streptomyces sp. NPDC050448]|uniref:phosphotransferase n=1 Tax=Streptomyces sp. NPDC050448 TaxID=3155404 RepID=UPI00342C9D62
MSGGVRHTVPIDVHLILRREGADGPEVLLSRRAGPVYASGLYHCPSGHLDPGEDIVTAVIREAREETGVVIDAQDVTVAVTVHHRPPVGAGSRIGVFFEVRRWSGTPRIMEPDLCDAMDWFPLEGGLPEQVVAYCRAGLDAYRAHLPAAVHFQEPDDPIHHAPDRPERTLLLPGPPTGGPGLPYGLRVFAEKAVGRIADVREVSWVRTGSRVWQVTGAGGGTWYLKRHRGPKFHAREVAALRTWTPELGAHAPRLIAADPGALAVVITALAGLPVHGMVMDPADEAQLQYGLGALAALLHHAAPAHPAGPLPSLGKLDRHLKSAAPHLADGDEDLVRALARMYNVLPHVAAVPTHGDLQYRNVLLTGSGEVQLLDFERAEYAAATRDLVRLSDTWTGRDDLRTAFLRGYGRGLTPEDELRLDCEAAFDAVSGIAYGMSHQDPEVTERGHRTLLRLHAAHRP